MPSFYLQINGRSLEVVLWDCVANNSTMFFGAILLDLWDTTFSEDSVWYRCVSAGQFLFRHGNFTQRIHVNHPSLVRSLRHFGISGNLRPGDENLRHLTVTSRFKKLHILFWQSIVKTQPNVHAFSTFCSQQVHTDLCLPG